MAVNRSYLRRKYSSGAYRMKKRMGRLENILVYLGVAVFFLTLIFFVRGKFFSDQRKIDIPLSDVSAFKIPYGTYTELDRMSVGYKLDFAELLAVYSLERDFFPAETVGAADSSDIEQSFMADYQQRKGKYNQKELEKYTEIFRDILSELKYFPIPAGFEGYTPEMYMYGDSWGSLREDFGDRRRHDGTDIFDRENIRGRIPIVSMTDGAVESIGWNELDGYRLGIRTENGTYYYYAHLDSYASDLAKDSKIRAGQFLGYMGDSGHGKKEGEKGLIQVHLHVGISPRTRLTKKEFWINPYIFLRSVESSRAEFKEP